jgi:Protein of unknown function (DUF1549)/Protein of unknown function (DUF1553)/Planctomycete cytochrome C
MREPKHNVAVAATIWSIVVGLGAQSGSAPRVSSRIDFGRDVRPILEQRCFACHDQNRRKGGLSLASYGDMIDGGRNGAVIRPGNGAGSLLVHRIAGEIEPQMPKDEDPLTAAQVGVIRRWIDQGARETPLSPPAPPPWEAPLELTRPAVPALPGSARDTTWAGWSSPIDRFVAGYLRRRGAAPPEPVPDAVFARRAYLDARGLLPTPEQLQAFVDDRAPGKRDALVTALLADRDSYAEHWMSFWNDLLRNEDGVSYFSETASRKSITGWLLASLKGNLPYDRFVRALLNPEQPGAPDGFLVGVNWRGETTPAVTPWMQAAQNAAQVFLGINLKCSACHDSFVNRWKLKDAYALAAYFSPEPTLQLYRCDVAQNRYAEPTFLLPVIAHTPASPSLVDRRAAAAASFTDPRNGRLARTLVNRIWQRLLGHGLVANPDEMDGRPWSPELLDFLASDLVDHGYDIKRLIHAVLTSRTYQMPSVTRSAEIDPRRYVFAGPEVRRLTAEQFADAIGAMTGEWSVHPVRGAAPPAAKREGPPPSLPTREGAYGREWRAASSDLTRALGRPIRDQIISTRAHQASTVQALELVNGEILTRRLSGGARRLLGELPAEPASLYNRTVAGRYATSTPFDIDITKVDTLWLVVQDTGSNAPEVLQPVWAQAELVGGDGAVTPLASLAPADPAGLRDGDGPVSVPGATGGVRVRNPSVLAYAIGGKGFARFRGFIGIENPKSEIGSTLNPQLRFYLFDAPPNPERLVPPAPGLPLPPPPVIDNATALVERVFRHALGRPPTAAERRLAEAALEDPAGSTRPSPQGLADLLWALVMKPEFQLIY